MALFIKGESDWQFVTSSSGGIGVEFIAVEGGKIWLQDPDGNVITYYYAGAGAGLTAGFKLPKIGKIQVKVRGKSVGGIVAPSSFPNGGKLYVLESFDGDELSSSDLTGVCMFAEVGGGLFAGGSATAMLLGMDPVWLGAILATPWVSSPFFMTKLARSATALLVMAGINVGIQAGAGGAGFIGGLT